jgi:hypothetical protein
MEDFVEMLIRVHREEAVAKASASMGFWQAEITGFWEGNPHSVTSAFFKSEDTARAWLLEAQAKIAPLDKWSAEDEFTDPRFIDPNTGDDYEAGVYQQWTKD